MKRLPQALYEKGGGLLFRQLDAEGRAAFVASVAWIHNHEILRRYCNGRRPRYRCSRTARRRRDGWWDGGNGSMRSRLRRGRNRNGAAVVAEAGEEWDRPADRDLR